MIFYKSRFAMQIKQDGLMSAKSLSLDQLRVSLSLHPHCRCRKRVASGHWPSLEKLD